MNYRHAFHAGNFADLLKHAVLLALLAAMKRDKAPVQVLDTHAGAGVYDLGGEAARKSGEAQAGVVRLMADDGAPAVFDALKAAVRRLNPDGGIKVYPGSPVLTAQALRKGDAYLGCELRADDQALLSEALARFGGGKGRALLADGYEEAARAVPVGVRRLILIDPPFEAPDEYRRIVQAVGAALQRDRAAIVAIWLPLKDLDTFDRFITELEGLEPPRTLIAEARLRPLHDPLKMNGCAMVVIGAPEDIRPQVEAATRWVAQTIGGAGAEARLWQVGG